MACLWAKSLPKLTLHPPGLYGYGLSFKDQTDDHFRSADL